MLVLVTPSFFFFFFFIMAHLCGLDKQLKQCVINAAKMLTEEIILFNSKLMYTVFTSFRV